MDREGTKGRSKKKKKNRKGNLKDFSGKTFGSGYRLEREHPYIITGLGRFDNHTHIPTTFIYCIDMDREYMYGEKKKKEVPLSKFTWHFILVLLPYISSLRLQIISRALSIFEHLSLAWLCLSNRNDPYLLCDRHFMGAVIWKKKKGKKVALQAYFNRRYTMLVVYNAWRMPTIARSFQLERWLLLFVSPSKGHLGAWFVTPPMPSIGNDVPVRNSACQVDCFVSKV